MMHNETKMTSSEIFIYTRCIMASSSLVLAGILPHSHFSNSDYTVLGVGEVKARWGIVIGDGLFA
jgi:hypothetical protein